MRRPAITFVALTIAMSSMEVRAQAPAPQQARRPILTAEGSGQSQAKPDFARVTATVSAKAPSLDAAMQKEQQSVARANTLVQSLASQGVEVERSNFSLGADRVPYPKPDAPQPPPSFTATTTFALKVSRLDNLNDIVDKLASSGLFELHAVSFEVSDKRSPLDEARRSAVADALHTAQVLADAAGVRLDEMVTVLDGNAAPRYDGQADLPMRSSFLIIPPATLSFNASVTISWRISTEP
jgi:uncharacterized protein YggE